MKPMKTYHKIQTVFKRNPETKFKTLLEGVYSLPEFEYLKDNMWIFTEKVDGTNIRVMWSGKDITFGGKTDNAQIPSFLITKLNERFNTIQAKLKFKEKFGEDGGVCLYGEGYGAKIQKDGGNYRQDQDFVLFDIKIGECWLERCNVLDIAEFLNIDIVPVIGEGTLGNMVSMVKNGFLSHWGDFRAEGIVARPMVEIKNRLGQRIITKLKVKDFLNETHRV